MSEQALATGVIHVAILGNPNCGKSSLFNALTGGRQKVGNYPGVTVERKEGFSQTPAGARVRWLDLPGAYSLDYRTLDEQVSRDVVLGAQSDEARPEVLVAVADATHLERSLAFVLELKALGQPLVLALNMMDLARARGMEVDADVLARELGVPVVPTVAVKKEGVARLTELAVAAARGAAIPTTTDQLHARIADLHSPEKIRARFREVDRVLAAATRRKLAPALWTERLDRIVMHPVWGTLILVGLLLLVFQAVFTWAGPPADLIEGAIGALGGFIQSSMPEGALRSLLVDGIIAGVGSVVVFLPQIVILFAFILLLEDSGYMARAAFLMDRLMGRVGLHGRAFIPLLSSFACAIPGIMATRTIENRRDRLATILVAPLTTCSARLPVYSLLIAAFIPHRTVAGFLNLQGLVMFSLYAAGIILPLLVAVILRKTLLKGPKPPLLMELPTYKWPSFNGIALGLWERARLFLRRAGTVILTLSVLIWFLASYPKAPEGATDSAISYSYAGRIGHAIEPLIKPLGFDWRVGVAFVPGFAAREVMVSALATVYAIEANENTDDAEEAQAVALGDRLAKEWSFATAMSLIVWYIIALQCLSTFAVVRRETNSWRWPLFMLGYLTAFAYAASFATYQLLSRFGGA